MRRLIIPLLLAALVAATPGCQKTTNSHSTDPIQAARAYFEQKWQNAPPTATNPNPRNTGPRTPDWSKARIVQLPNTEAVVVPVHYTHPFYIGGTITGNRQYPVDQLAQLMVYKDSARAFHAEMVTAMPDSNYKGASGTNSSFTGMLVVDQWDGRPLARYLYDGHPPRVWNLRTTGNGGTRLKQADALVEICYEFVGYNYPASNPSAGFSYVEDLGCTYSFINETPGSALIDGTGYQTVAAGGIANLQPMYVGDGGVVDGANLTFNFDNLPGINLATYFHCFDYIPDQGATYSVTLCADIPVDNNSGALLNSNLHPGHTFIILTKTNGGVSLSQSFGFYPESPRISAAGIYVQSEIKDDGATNHEYDASVTLPNISKLDFQTVQNMAVNLAGQEYSAYNYNCTNYALQVFNSIQVNTPITVPDWIGAYTGIDFGTTPNGLYNTLLRAKTMFAGISNPNVSIGPKYAPGSSGACN